MYGDALLGSEDMGKVVVPWALDRLQELIDTSGGDIVCGGKVHKDIRYCEPTVITNPDKNSKVMQEEIFGPILPVVTFTDIGEAIDLINSKDKPLGIYYFGKYRSNPNLDRVNAETSSGAFLVNEVMA